MRGPRGKNDAIRNDQGCAFLVHHGIEMNESVAAVVASAREHCTDFDWPGEFFFAARKIQCMEPLMISARRVLAHRHKIKRSVGTSSQVDYWRSGDSDFRFD